MLQSDPLPSSKKLGYLSISSHLAYVEASSWGIEFPALLAFPTSHALIVLQAEVVSESALAHKPETRRNTSRPLMVPTVPSEPLCLPIFFGMLPVCV